MLTKLVRRQLYCPDQAIRELQEEPSDYDIKFKDVYFRSQDGCRLHGWWIPHRRPSATVMFCHGNGENIGDWANLSLELDFLNVNVFLFDYRGYGKSKGSPSEIGISGDVRAAFDKAFRLCSSVPIIVIGRSLGGAVAIECACTRPVAGLVVESTFSCLADAVKTVGWLRLVPKRLLALVLKQEEWDSLSKVSQLKMPKLFAHSRKDEIVPFELGRQLFDRASEPKHFCYLAGDHQCDKFVQKRYHSALSRFVDVLSNAQATGGI